MDAAVSRIIDAMNQWDPLGEPTWTESRFESHAMELFERHLTLNEAYRRFCASRGVESAAGLDGWRAIPAAPTDAFKHVRLSVAAPGDEVRTFRTSGTTLGARGEHHFGTLSSYDASIPGPFRRWMTPEGVTSRVVALTPDASSLPDSSLSYMLDAVMKAHDDGEGAFHVRPSSGRLVVDIASIEGALDRAVSDGVPTLVLGTAFAFVELFDSSEKSWELPPGSALMETGGLKGRTRTVAREDIYSMFTTRLGVPVERCVSEYSMTELSSQAYTDNLWSSSRGEEWSDGALRTPPWARIELVDPATLEPLGPSAPTGLIRWYDLANTESVLAVQTSDVGERLENGAVRLVGRAPDAQLRGCSLTIEEIVDASK